jgi:hypothetical protein
LPWGADKHVSTIDQLAPTAREPVDYDRVHLALYAALLDAHDAGDDWRTTASTIMHLDVAEDTAEACWRSHLERAKWIIGSGLEHALIAFASTRSLKRQG